MSEPSHRRLVLICLLAAALVVPPAHAAVAPSRSVALVPRPGGALPLGINDLAWDPASVDYGGRVTPQQLGGLYRELGARHPRITIDWRVAQAAEPWIDLSWYRRMYDRIRAEGLRPLVIVMWTPRWAATPLAQAACDWSRDCRTVPDVSKLPAFGRFVGEVARQMPEAIGIEIWNEPNYEGFWGTTPKPDPTYYALMVRAAYEGVKAVNPRMPVVAGSMAPGGPGQTAPDVWLRSMLFAGAASYMDAVSFHPYPWKADLTNPENPYLRMLRTVRGVLAEYGLDGGRMRLWLTEIGASTATGWYSEREQADTLTAVYRHAAASPDVDVLFVHTLLDRCTALADDECMYGIVRRDFRRKPAFPALAGLL